MRSFRLLAATVLVSASFISGCQTATTRPDLPRRLETLFTDLHDRGLFDGAVVIGKGPDIIWESGFGYANVEEGVRFTPDTPTDGASLAKTFTSALVLMLAGEGFLDLDEPAQRFLPELPYPTVTLRHLLSHSSGIPVMDYDYFDAFLPAEQVRTTEVLLGVLAGQRQPLAFTPGTSFEYSSLGYDLAALAASRAAGKTYGELLSERFFRPLNITSAFLRPGRFRDFPPVRTLGYRRIGEKQMLHEVFDREAFHGGSNLYISARDLHRWNSSFLTQPLLNKTGLDQAAQPSRIGAGPSGLTLGSWYRSEDRSAFWYSGHLQGFHNEVFRNLDSRLSIVYVSNNTMEPWLQKNLIRAVNAIMAGGDPKPLRPPAAEEIGGEDHLLLHGRWVMSDGELFTIESTGSRLGIVRRGVSYRMVQLHPRAFYVPGLDLMVGFVSDSPESFSRICTSSNTAERCGTRESFAPK